MNRTNTQLTFVSAILLLITTIMTFLYPEALNALFLTPTEARVIIMTLISFILLLSFLQIQMTLFWRIFCLIASFLTLIESILMLGAWHVILN